MTDERPDPLSVPCPWCRAAAGESCSIPTRPGTHRSPHYERQNAADAGVTPRENRPTMTPPPNRPTEELDQ